MSENEPVVPIVLIDPVPYQKIMAAYNEAVAGTPLPRVLRIGEDRKLHLQARWLEDLFRDNYAEVFRKAAQSPLMRGELWSPTHRHWKADFDWLISNDGRYVKVLEGRYDKEQPAPGNTDEQFIAEYYAHARTREGAFLTQSEIRYQRDHDGLLAKERGITLRQLIESWQKAKGVLK